MNVETVAVLDSFVRILLWNGVVSAVIVGGDQADLVRDRLSDEMVEHVDSGPINDPRDNIALTLNCADDNRFVPRAAARFAGAIWRPSAVTIAALSANVGLIDFNDAHEFAKFLVSETGAQPMAHVPSSLVRPETHVTVDLQCADSLFAGEHQMQHAEPFAERLIGVLEDCPGDMGEAVSTALAAV